MIEGAFRVLDDFEAVDASTEDMKALTLQPEEELAFATAALALRFGESHRGPVSAADQGRTVDRGPPARRPEDLGQSLWTTFQRAQETPCAVASRAAACRAGASIRALSAASTEA